MEDNNGGSTDSVNDEESSSSLVCKLRQRWELASVLNFFSVFESLIGKELKMSAEEIENALIQPNASLAKLHVTLLKDQAVVKLLLYDVSAQRRSDFVVGIPPINKKLSNPDVWVTVLCKKLAEWWPWVAEGEVPLTEAKGEEILKYKKLDPTIRLLMLKALCDIRTEQDDLVSYINDALKEGAQISLFRKDKIGQDRNGISYWYDGNSVIGHRLYKEINNFTLKQKHRGKNCLDPQQETNVKWETLATNLDEFRKVSEKLSSCQAGVEAAVHETIETEVIPVLEKDQKKKEKDLKRRQREEAFLSGSLSYAAGVTRSCRTRGPVKYTFDEYDRTIEEAIKQTSKRKGRDVKRNDSKHHKREKRGGGASDGDSKRDTHSEEESPASTSADEENDQQGEGKNNGEKTEQLGEYSASNGENNQRGEGSENDDDDRQDKSSEDDEDDRQDKSSENDEEDDQQDKSDENDNTVKSDNEMANASDLSEFELDNGKPEGKKCVNGSFDCVSGKNLRKARNPEAKNRYRQRPTRNSAFVVSDSEDGSSSKNVSGDASDEGDPSVVADSEDEISS